MSHKIAAGLVVAGLVSLQIALAVAGWGLITFTPPIPGEVFNIVTFGILPYLLLRMLLDRLEDASLPSVST